MGQDPVGLRVAFGPSIELAVSGEGTRLVGRTIQIDLRENNVRVWARHCHRLLIGEHR